MDVAVIGTGYVGLVTAAVFSRLGHRVVAADQDAPKIALLERGGVPFHEPGLPELLAAERASGRLRFTTDVAAAVAHGRVAVICVGTPPDPEGRADLSALAAVARTIAGALRGYTVVVEKSTVPVRTGARVRQTIERHAAPGVEFDVASNPEFLRQGSAVRDALEPDRVVLGVPGPRAEAVLRELYAGAKCPVIVTDVASAELIKHASNSFLAMKISFINAVARVCERAGANVEEVARGMGLDPRIGASFLRAGIGYGGSCFRKDLDAFAQIASELGSEFRLLREVQAINTEQRGRVLDLLREELWVLRGKRIPLLGLAFKPDTDDVRDAPSLTLAGRLLAEGAVVVGHDPVAGPRAKEACPGLVLAPDPAAAVEGADACVLVTEWDAYRGLDLARLKATMREPVVIDGRNLWDPAEARAAGLRYRSIGRP